MQLRLLPFVFALCGVSFLPACNSASQSPTEQASSSPSSSPSPVASSSIGQTASSLMPHSPVGHTLDLGPADANYDLRFIDAMIPHHVGAVEMAQTALKQSRRPEILTLAKAIVAAQDQEIAEMKAWRQRWYPKAPKVAMMWHGEMSHMMPMAASDRASMQMNVDLGKADAQFDQRFLDAMIPHHEGAVKMAEDLAKKSKRPEMQTLAKAIVSSQQAEINEMKAWRKAWYGK